MKPAPMPWIGCGEGAPPEMTGEAVGSTAKTFSCGHFGFSTWAQAVICPPVPTPVISGGSPAPHPIQGIGAGFVPANLHTEVLDGVIQVEAEEAREWARRSAREEGMLVGISSGATLAAIAKKLLELPAGARVLGCNYDTGERYLSVPDFQPT